MRDGRPETFQRFREQMARRLILTCSSWTVMVRRSCGCMRLPGSSRASKSPWARSHSRRPATSWLIVDVRGGATCLPTFSGWASRCSGSTSKTSAASSTAVGGTSTHRMEPSRARSPRSSAARRACQELLGVRADEARVAGGTPTSLAASGPPCSSNRSLRATTLGHARICAHARSTAPVPSLPGAGATFAPLARESSRTARRRRRRTRPYCEKCARA